MVKLVSACLLGIKCRYDGESNLNEKVIELAKEETLIPVCPEQLGGLPTPREPAEQRGERVITKSGRDVTKNFVRGAKQVLKLAKLFGTNEAILKQRIHPVVVDRFMMDRFLERSLKVMALQPLY